jgi:hypothetical protein
MEREILMEKMIGQIERLSIARILQINDFIEFIARQSEDAMITEGLQELSSYGNVYDFLDNEPEIYSVDDLKIKFV